MATGDAVMMERGGPAREPGRARLVRYAGLAVVALALISVAATFAVLTGLTPITPSRRVTAIALVINGVLVAILVGLVGYEIWQLGQARWTGRAGARLHVRIVALFSLMAVLPAVLVAAVATITLSRGLDRWFQERTMAIVENSVAVADAYVDEHARVLRGDLIAMANDIDRARQLYEYEPGRFDAFLQAQTSLRLLPAAYLLRGDGTVVTSAIVNPDVKLRMPPTPAMQEAAKGQPVMIAPGDADQVGGIMKLKAYDDLYLYVARPMDPRVVTYVRLTAENAEEYHRLEENRLGTQIAFGLVYAGVTLVLLVSAIWLGFGFANRLVSPIRDLIAATDSVARGNLRAQVYTDPNDGDLAHLGETFNQMTTQLRSQRADLLAANEQIDQRRRFTETVLAGVTAGVLGIDSAHRVSLANRSALDLLDTDEASLIGRRIEEVLPDVAEMIGEAVNQGAFLRSRQRQITLRRGRQERIASVRITTDRTDRKRPGYVATLDDITDLVAAQRTSAWADVARRIAHEIKNPLTPIQLSAERIKRRYGKRIEDDRAVFDECIDTIVRQVGDIGRMVNEFSAFARMPKPVIERRDIREAAKEAVFLQSVGNPDIVIRTDFPDEPVIAEFDQRLVTQAIANLVKNAVEAIEQTNAADRGSAQGQVDVRVYRSGEGEIVAEIVDNGIGLPAADRQRLLEPYMTTRDKGTGLGLAIVRKIAEEHGGRIELLDAAAAGRDHRGACVRLILPSPIDRPPGAYAVGESTSNLV